MSIVPDFPWNIVLCNRFRLRWNDFNDVKNCKSPFGSWIQGSETLADFGHFSRNFGEIKGRIESDLKGGINVISYNRN